MLRRHIGERAARDRQARLLKQVAVYRCQSEAAKVNGAFIAVKKVRRFDIAVHQTLLMHQAQRIAEQRCAGKKFSDAARGHTEDIRQRTVVKGAVNQGVTALKERVAQGF